MAGIQNSHDALDQKPDTSCGGDNASESNSDTNAAMKNDKNFEKPNDEIREQGTSQTNAGEQRLCQIVEEMVVNAPTFSILQMHSDLCCNAADAAMKTNVLMANERGGLSAVLATGSDITAWGPNRCEWLCDAWKHRKELDCGSQAALVHKMTELSKEYLHGQVSVHRVRVIMQCSTHEAARWNQLFQTTNRLSYGKWIHQSGRAVYHECLATYSVSCGLKVFDPNNKVWFLPSYESTSVGAIFAWYIYSDSTTLDKLIFGDHMIPTKCWFTLMPSLVSASVKLIGCSRSETSIDQPIPSYERQLIVYISGVTNNNDNPSPGLGVARSLRNGFRSNQDVSLQLVAADFSLESAGLGDPVFDRRIVFPSWEHCSSEQHTEEVIKLLQSDSSFNTHTLYISCLDVETELLARTLPKYLERFPELKQVAAQILIPPSSALDQTRKPHIHAASALDFKISHFLEVSEENNNDPAVLEWCVSHGFPVIVKGQSYETVVANSWSQVQAGLAFLQKLWGRSSTFLQRAVVGSEGSIIFSAYKGQLLTAALMQKSMVTSSRKVWSSQVSPIPTDLLQSLRVAVRNLEWTGGGEIEFIETIGGDRYLIDWNSRFPAWVYGAIAAVELNLPLALIAGAIFELFGTKILPEELHDKLERNVVISPISTGDFVRTVSEQRNHGVQLLTTAGPNDSTVLRASSCTASKGGNADRPHPSRNTNAGKLLVEDESIQSSSSSSSSSLNENQGYLNNLPTVEHLNQVLAGNETNTPLIFFNPDLMCTPIDDMKQTISAAFQKMGSQYAEHVNVNLALSIKTNPSVDVLVTGLNKGILAEAISLSEVRAALAAGFPSEKIILNGPGKWFDQSHNAKPVSMSLLAVIADSAIELEQLSDAIVSGRPLNNVNIEHLVIQGAEYIGVRLAVPGTGSRFGVDTGNSEMLKCVANALGRLPANQKTAFHFHFASSTLGIPAWVGAVKAALVAAATIDKMAVRACSMIDFGGGWAANTFVETTAVSPLIDIFTPAMNDFPALKDIIFEPGKALVQSASVMVTRVLAVREFSVQAREGQNKSNDAANDNEETDERVAVLDTSIAELPDINSHTHELAWLSQEHKSNNTWQPIITSGGTHALYGRICMEHDVLARSIQLPKDLKEGDFIAIGSVGAYDMSMAYSFGSGTTPIVHLYKLETHN